MIKWMDVIEWRGKKYYVDQAYNFINLLHLEDGIQKSMSVDDVPGYKLIKHNGNVNDLKDNL